MSSSSSTSTAMGPASAETGIGFLDHMLDLLARHRRLGLEVEVSGELETGAQATPWRTLVLGQALNKALGDRRDLSHRLRSRADGRVTRRARAGHLRSPVLPFDADLPTARRRLDPSSPRSTSARSPTAEADPARLEVR